jgi:hypothetical protein
VTVEPQRREFSDYIVYADESGDPNRESLDANYPVFVLNFCVFRKDEYASSVLPAVAAFKFAHFGHDMVVLHENEIRLQRPPFSFLRDEQTQARFMVGLDQLITGADFTIIAAVFDKRRLADQDLPAIDPYELSFNVCIERLHNYLESVGQQELKTHIIIESRGSKEDRQLEMAFQRVQHGARSSNEAMPAFSIEFADKKSNSAGLQIADLTARPIGRHFIDPRQPNRAWNALEPKLLRSQPGDVNWQAMTVQPK